MGWEASKDRSGRGLGGWSGRSIKTCQVRGREGGAGGQ